MPVKLKGALKPGEADRRYYMIRVQVGGRREVISSRTRDRKLAEKKELLIVDALRNDPRISKHALAELIHGKASSGKSTTAKATDTRLKLSDAIRRCFADREIWGRIKSRDAHEANLKHLRHFLGDDFAIEDIDAPCLKRFTEFLLLDDKEQRAPGLAPGGADRVLAVTSRLLRASSEWDDGPKAVPKVKLLKESKPRMYVLSQSDEARLFEAVIKAETAHAVGARIDGQHCLQLFRVLLESGMRLGEALNLRWPDIVDAGGGKMIRLWRRDELKTSSSVRTIPVTPECQDALDKCSHLKGGPFATLTKQRAGRAWRNAKRIAGIEDEDCVIHSLRHTCATRLLEAVGDIKLVQEWLGHSTIVTTARIYAHVPTHRLVGAAAALTRLRGT
jgi:integrase